MTVTVLLAVFVKDSIKTCTVGVIRHFSCWLNGLELIAQKHVRSGVFYRQLQNVTEVIFILVLFVCSVHQRFATRMHNINPHLTFDLTAALLC